MIKPKAHELPNSTQAAIGREYDQAKKAGRDVTYGSLAAKWNCTVDQVRSYVTKYRSGAYAGRQGRKPAARTARNPLAPVSTSIDQELQMALEDLSTADLTPNDRIFLLEKLTKAMRTVQQTALTGHLRSQDALLIASIIRRFEPEATDEDIVFIINEERAKCLASL